MLLANTNPNIPFKIGRRTCAQPDNPQKNARFPDGEDPNALQVLRTEFGLTEGETVALMGM